MDVCRGEEASFMMAFFGPGVGEIYMEAVNGCLWYEIGKEDSGVSADNPNIFELPSADAVDGIAAESCCLFDAEKIDIGEGFGVVEKKCALAATDFDVDRAGTSENQSKIEWDRKPFKI